PDGLFAGFFPRPAPPRYPPPPRSATVGRQPTTRGLAVGGIDGVLIRGDGSLRRGGAELVGEWREDPASHLWIDLHDVPEEQEEPLRSRCWWPLAFIPSPSAMPAGSAIRQRSSCSRTICSFCSASWTAIPLSWISLWSSWPCSPARAFC